MSGQAQSSYPLTQAVNKHDLLCVKGASDSSSSSAVVFSSTSELFKKVINYDDKDFARNGKPEQKGFVYSYKDGPEYPGVCLFCVSFCHVDWSMLQSCLREFLYIYQTFSFCISKQIFSSLLSKW